MKILPLLIAFTLLFTQCQNSSSYNQDSAKEMEYELMEALEEYGEYEDYEEYDDYTESTSVNNIPTSPISQTQSFEQKLIKEGSLSFTTDSIHAAASRIKSLVKKHNGYLSNEISDSYSYRDQLDLSIRVPAKNFDALINQIGKGIEAFDSKSISSKDVSEEFIDLEARIKTKKETEIRYRELLSKANSVTEILEIESYLTELRAEIESLEGRLRYLSDRVSLSTLEITIYSPEKSNETGYGSKFEKGFENGWDGFVLFFVGLTHLWPFLVLGLITWFLVRRLIRKRKASKNTAS